ncbi:MAG: hypothetical protein ACYCOO_09755 [Chitinophagaceae bacterium]
MASYRKIYEIFVGSLLSFQVIARYSMRLIISSGNYNTNFIDVLGSLGILKKAIA